MQATYVSSNQFRISTDKTSEFLAGRRIRANCGGNYEYSTIQSSIYSDPDTTVTIEESILTSNLSEVYYGIINIGEQGSFPNHSHNGDEGTGGELSLLTLSDTPSLYEEREYLRATTSGVEWTIPEAETVVVRVKEENISAITKGQVCAVVTGSSGVKAEVGLCDCDDSNKIRILGLAQDNIPQNEDGIVAYKGVLTNVDTRTTNSGVNPNGETWASMDLLWATNIPGGMTNVRPTNGRSIKAARTVKGNSATDSLIIISLENPIWNTAAAGEDVVLRVGDSVGVNKVSIRNYDNDEVADFDSYGNLTVSGTVDNVDVAVFKSDFDSHDHDNRYYTESEIDTISGTLQTNIDAKPDTEVFLVEGVPSNSMGKENDIAIDQDVGTVYKKHPADIDPYVETFYPAVGGDDGYSDPNFRNGLNHMHIGVFSPDDLCAFIRCPNITIDQGSIITEAYLRVTANNTLSSTVVNTNIYFNDADNAVAPTSTNELNALDLTSATAWNNIGTWTDGTKYNTPSLVSILQEVIDRSGWSSGSALQILIKNNGSSAGYTYRTISSIEYLSGTEKAELHITWTAPPGTSIWNEKLSLDFLKLSDTPTTYSGSEGKYLKTTISGIEFVEDLYTKSEVDTISGSLQTSIDSMPVTFLELEDTPATYSGSEGEYIKTTSSGVEFSQIALLDLSDTPTTYSGVSGKYLKTTNSGIEFSDIDSEYWESVDVFLDENYSNDKGLPTQVERGLFKGYSMPIWSTPANQYEELVFRIRVPFRWDGVTNPTFMILVSISAIEDVGDKFKFQMEWESKGVSNVIPDTTAEVLTDEVTVTEGTAYYSYLASASLDAAKLIPGDNLQFRVRRMAATDPQVSNEIIIWHWDSRWKMNKLGTVSE